MDNKLVAVVATKCLKLVHNNTREYIPVKPVHTSVHTQISSASYEAGSSRVPPLVKGGVIGGGGNGGANASGRIGGTSKDKSMVTGNSTPITFAAVASGTNAAGNAAGQLSNAVNSSIQQLAKKYCQVSVLCASKCVGVACC